MYKIELRKQIKKAGRTRKWLYDSVGINKQTFWRKVNADTLTPEEKKEINKLLSK